MCYRLFLIICDIFEIFLDTDISDIYRIIDINFIHSSVPYKSFSSMNGNGSDSEKMFIYIKFVYIQFQN